MKIRINADDFGISKGVNLAVQKMMSTDRLNSVSIMTNGFYVQDAIDSVINHNAIHNNKVQTGLHFNLTTGKASGNSNFNSILVNENGNFKNCFVKLFFYSLWHKKKLTYLVKEELEAQVAFLLQNNIQIEHIDGHRHIHFIPAIFQIVIETAIKYNIQNIRIINENLLHSFKLSNYNKSFFFNDNILKFILLKICYYWNLKLITKHKLNKEYFFSILYTCRISNKLTKLFKKITKNNSQNINYEIMIHPGMSEMDKNDYNIVYEKNHLISKYRDIEAELDFLL